MLQHEGVHKFLPSAGFHGSYVGDPDLGAEEKQPGGWVYNLLPYIEQTAIHDIGAGLTGSDKKRALANRDAIAIDLLNCPSRRPPIPYPNAARNIPANAIASVTHGRSDYAQNAGDIKALEQWCDINAPKFDLVKAGQTAWRPSLDRSSGVGYCGTLVKTRHITDGLSNTYAIGERFIEPKYYETGTAHADDWPMYTGYQDDLYRSVYCCDALDPNSQALVPLEDTDGVDGINDRFGSAHPGGCHMAMADGSVTTISYDIDPEVHRQNGHRSDGGGPRQPDLPDDPP